MLGEYYHIYSRIILNVPEFENKDNANKLAQTFLLANSTNSGKAFDYLRNNINISLKDALKISKSGEKLTEVLCYAIMPNHYHFLVKEIREKGITDFYKEMQHLNSKVYKHKNRKKGPAF